MEDRGEGWCCGQKERREFVMRPKVEESSGRHVSASLLVPYHACHSELDLSCHHQYADTT
jgi:hypothetical protein